MYTEEERFNQTIESINSVKKYSPDSLIFLYDASETMPKKEYFDKFNEMGVSCVYTGMSKDVANFSSRGLKSLSEALSQYIFMDWLKNQNINLSRLYKLSGRYRLTDNFRPGLEHTDAFVFKKSVESWMNQDAKNVTGAERVYDTRLWHMDYNLFDTFFAAIPNILNDCAQYGIDIEHAYWKHLHSNKVVELDVIGVCGNKAPNGEWVDE